MAAAVETNLKLKQEVDALATKLATLEANVAAKQKAMEDEATQKRALKEQARRVRSLANLLSLSFSVLCAILTAATM